MRLKQVKLSGFKSFCDPTTFELPGQLVGIVGPNGCGKSNIIDATRWVLGESRAAELRGESMQDVIFNGSAERKPASRASVELVFDNSLGRVGGAWSGYAEISVKRVLTRDGQSNYYINQQNVRRKDVHDIFLGTGLGPRAYAIIGQGTISRIIEAKPDELRVFFEEAAGVSKYKERRRETESRLADTRDNLTRVEDILRELNGQITKLEGQAEVATRYRELESERDDKQRWLWMIRRDDARAECDRLAADERRIALELESLQADLRAAEATLESLREASHRATDEVNRRQATFYEVNSRIATVEAEIRMVANQRQQLDQRLGLLGERINSARELAGSSTALLEDVAMRLEAAGQRQMAAEEAVGMARETLDAAVERERESRSRHETARQAAGQAGQARQVADVERRSIDESVRVLTQRRDRTAAQLDQLLGAPLAALAPVEDELEAARQDEAETAQTLETDEARGHALEAQREPAQQALRAASSKSSTIEARIAVLSQLQARMQGGAKVRPWLAAQGIAEGVERIWQRITIEPGWELAVEAALRERVHAVEVLSPDRMAAMLDAQPPGKIALFLGHAASRPAAMADTGARDGDHPGAVMGAARERLAPLASRVHCSDAALAPLVTEWLEGFFVAESTAQAFAARSDLPRGGRFVVREGHAIGRADVSFFALDTDEDGVLARQQELQNLARELRAQQLLTEEAREHAARIEAGASAQQGAIRAAREAHARAVRRVSAATIEHERLAQAVRSRDETVARLREEAEELAMELAERSDALDAALARIEAIDAEREQHEEALAGAAEAARRDQDALAAARTAAQQAELAQQEGGFAVRSAEQEAANLRERIARADETLNEAIAERERLAEQRAALDDAEARARLDSMLAERLTAESMLAQCRNEADELTARLRRQDEERLRHERGQEPLRARMTELQLKAQAARITAEQMDESLATAEGDLDAVAARLAALESRPKPGWLQAEVSRIGQAITRLGPVNLAALSELTESRERQGFLASQSADLFEAMTTLENAIRTIDQETRSLLQQTYDTVNAEFGRLFPMLFGGGEARLVLTGGEILDAGVQVVAQPPGKKNASIHLLSGGEKALTAIALVFAIFKLNPAPFCLLDEVDAPLDDANTERYSRMVQSMSGETQFVFITHNKIAMEMAEQLIGVTMQERGVSRLVAVDLTSAGEFAEAA